MAYGWDDDRDRDRRWREFQDEGPRRRGYYGPGAPYSGGPYGGGPYGRAGRSAGPQDDDRFARRPGYYGYEGGRRHDRDDDPYNRHGDYGRQGQSYGRRDRDWMDRAGDEVASWFGDDDAERRRHIDEIEDRYRDRRDDRGPRRASRWRDDW